MPFEQIRFGDWLLDVNVDATRRAYLDAKLISLCRCQGCQNHVTLCSSLSPNILAVFNRLGIDPTKEGEMSVLYQTDDGSLLYNGFYHLVGHIIEAPEPFSSFPCI